MALGIIERQADDGVFKHQAIAVCQFHRLSLLLTNLRFVGQRTDNADRFGITLLILCHADVMQIAPVGLIAGKVEIPTVAELCRLQLAVHQFVQQCQRTWQVVRVNVAFPVIVGDAIALQHVTIEILGIVIGNIV